MNYTDVKEQLGLFFIQEKVQAASEITNKSYSRTDNSGTYLGGTSSTKTVSFYYLEIRFKNVPIGLPAFEISSAVFLRNFFRSAFSIFGVSKKRKKFSLKSVNKSFDFYFPKNTSLKEIEDELNILFNDDANKLYLDLIQQKFKGDLRYNNRYLTFSTLQIPESKEELEKLKAVLLTIVKWVNLVKTITPNPTKSVKCIGKFITPEVSNEIKWEHPDGEFSRAVYPESVYDFIHVISKDYWTDVNYREKPVDDWLKDPTLLATLNVEELKSLFTHFVRTERFCEGFWQTMIEKDYVRHVLSNPNFKS